MIKYTHSKVFIGVIIGVLFIYLFSLIKLNCFSIQKRINKTNSNESSEKNHERFLQVTILINIDWEGTHDKQPYNFIRSLKYMFIIRIVATCIWNMPTYVWRLHSWLSGKESAYQCRRPRRHGFDLGWEDSLEKGMATHSTIVAWKIPWAEDPGGLLSHWAYTHRMYVWASRFLLFLNLLKLWPPCTTELGLCSVTSVVSNSLWSCGL